MSADATARPQGAPRQRVTRLIAGYAAIAFILPYLALKIAWISGSPVGMLDESRVADPSMISLNVLTFCMDTVAILLALAFTHDWGLRVRAWPLLFPMWVGMGFLAPIAVAVPTIALARVLGLDPAERPDSGAGAGAQALIEPWARGVVFTSFVGQGLALITAFILYVRARWGGLLHARTGDGQQPRRVVVLVGTAASVVAASIGLLHLLWAAGVRLGLPPHLWQDGGANFHVLHATFGLAALAAAAGIHRFGRWPLWLSLSLTWAGAGTMFSWGAWLVLGTVLRQTESAWLFTALNVVKAGAGLTIGALIGLRVTAAARPEHARRDPMRPILLATGACVLLAGMPVAADPVRDKGLAAIDAWEAGRPEDAITLFQEAIGVIQGGTEAGLARSLPDRAGEYVGGDVESASGTWGSGAQSVQWISATRRYEVPGTERRVAVTLSTSPGLVRAQRAKLATYDNPETLAMTNTAPGRKVELVDESGFRGWTMVEAGKEAHMAAVGEKLVMTIDVLDGDAAALAAFRAAIPLSRLVRLDGR